MEIIKTKKVFYQYGIAKKDGKFNVEYRLHVVPALVLSVIFYFVAKLAVTAMNFSIPNPVLLISIPTLVIATRKWIPHEGGSDLTREEAIALIEKQGNGIAETMG